MCSLDRWLSYIYSIHSVEMDLGLERVKKVADQLGVLKINSPIIVVGGTNGKGSTVATLESIYVEAGYHTGTFTSPYLLKHNELVKIDKICAKDDEFCKAYTLIENKRGGISLTPFEFNTLAALLIFQWHDVDILILEIGLGGRLDAVNIVDSDVAIITSIAFDHMERLGSSLESIAFEKAGIVRYKKPLIYGGIQPEQAIIDQTNTLQSPLHYLKNNFDYSQNKQNWSFWCEAVYYQNLPKSTLYLPNISCALMAVTLLQSRLPISRFSIDQGLQHIKLLGRIEVVQNRFSMIYDVSHNPAAVGLLSEYLSRMTIDGKVHAVFSMLSDKDIRSSINAIKDQIDDWYIAPLSVKRAASLYELQSIFHELNIQSVSTSSSIKEALFAAEDAALQDDVIVVFGSFHTICDALNAREQISVS